MIDRKDMQKIANHCKIMSNLTFSGSILDLDWLSKAPKGSFDGMVECENQQLRYFESSLRIMYPLEPKTLQI